jgi:hypothetical protein
MKTASFAWDVPAEFNFARDVVDVLAREDRLGLVAMDVAITRSPRSRTHRNGGPPSCARTASARAIA